MGSLGCRWLYGGVGFDCVNRMRKLSLSGRSGAPPELRSIGKGEGLRNALLGLAAAACTLLGALSQLVETPEWPRAALAAPATAPPPWALVEKQPVDQARHKSDDELIASQTVCVASSVWSAGELGETLAYHFERRGNRLHVGYFAFWSSERPWGVNALSLGVAPALVVDGVYSHGLFVLPGVRHAIYGAGDIEGASVIYEISGEKLIPVRGYADDETHDEVQLSQQELWDARGRVVLLSEAWSHQLGAKGAAQRLENAADQRCFEGQSLRPLTPELAERFRLGSFAHPRRAKPAWRLLER